MSQTYHCQLKASVEEVIVVGDTIRHRIHLTEILPAAQMVDLLRQVLQDNGFQKEGGEDGDRWVLDDGSERTILDLDTQEVETTRQEERVVRTEVTGHGGGYSREGALEDARRSLAAARQQAHSEIQAEGKRNQARLSDQMVAQDTERQQLLHLLLQQVYAESLKRKARQLGDVVDIQEGTSASGEYELIIKVEA